MIGLQLSVFNRFAVLQHFGADLRLRYKLWSSSGISIALMASILWIGMSSLGHLNGQIDTIVHRRYESVTRANELLRSAQETNALVRTIVSAVDGRQVTAVMTQIAKTSESVPNNIEAMRGLSQGDSEELNLLKAVEESQNAVSDVLKEILTGAEELK